MFFGLSKRGDWPAGCHIDHMCSVIFRRRKLVSELFITRLYSEAEVTHETNNSSEHMKHCTATQDIITILDMELDFYSIIYIQTA